MVVGPAAGGVLAERPVNGLFRRYPYALPNIFAAGSRCLRSVCHRGVAAGEELVLQDQRRR